MEGGYDYSRDVDVKEDHSSKKRPYEGRGDYGRDAKRDRSSNNRNRLTSKKRVLDRCYLGAPFHKMESEKYSHCSMSAVYLGY